MAAAIWKGTPNFNQGRGGLPIDHIVIHYIVGTLAAADATFADAKSKVSAHYGIGEGELHQYVAESDTAWHAGNFTMNQRSIGIEHSADVNRAPDQFTYDTSIALCTRICRDFGIDPMTGIIPHNAVKDTSCPGTVDIERIKAAVAAGL